MISAAPSSPLSVAHVARSAEAARIARS